MTRGGVRANVSEISFRLRSKDDAEFLLARASRLGSALGLEFSQEFTQDGVLLVQALEGQG